MNTEAEDEDDLMEASTRGSGQSVNVRLVGYDKPFFVALAIALSVGAIFYSFEAGREAALSAYWLSRCEVFLEQLSSQGIKVPQDLLNHKGDVK